MTNVEKVKVGELAIVNDDEKALRKCLIFIWPNDTDTTDENYKEKYYKLWENSSGKDLSEWMMYSENEKPNLPTILATELLKEIEAPVFSPKRGQLVLMKNTGGWDKRIYLTTIEGSAYPFVSVAKHDTDEFLEGRPFSTFGFKEMKPIERTKLTKAEIANRLGLDINEFDIEG